MTKDKVAEWIPVCDKLPPENSYHWIQRKDGTVNWNYRERGASIKWLQEWAEYWMPIEKPVAREMKEGK